MLILFPANRQFPGPAESPGADGGAFDDVRPGDLPYAPPCHRVAHLCKRPPAHQRLLISELPAPALADHTGRPATTKRRTFTANTARRRANPS